MSADTGKLLSEHRFFKGLPPAITDALAECATVRKVAAGAMLAREGDAANEFYVIVDGRLAIETVSPGKKPITLQTLHGGEVVGWSWMFPPFQWVFDAHVLADATLLSLDARCVRFKIEQNHELGYQLMRRYSLVLSQRLKATRLLLLDLYGRADGHQSGVAPNV